MTETFTIAQLSDPHLSSLDNVRARDLLSKRVLGYLSWRLNRRAKYRPEILAELVRDLKSQQPDHTVVTGDLTHIGLPQEFQEAKDWLDALGMPSEVTIIPGNHDAYVEADWDSTLALWIPYMGSDIAGVAGGCERQACFPSLRVRDSVAFIGLSTAHPSAPFLATGSIGHSQLQALERVLVETGERRLFRIILLHHPPIPGTVPWRKQLTDHASFRSVVARCGAELVLHGHAHCTSIRQIVAQGRIVPAIGVPAASARSHHPDRGAQYHLYRLTRQVSTWSIQLSVRGYSPAEQRFMELGTPIALEQSLNFA
ncbi:MAG: metallophosphatase [Nitrospiraceae bacterium]|jgi:3',5'-cyclic AMP phosphodiesterase CpdA|nr:metallophosphatase [Nitrospiraceae bacterium]|tara:strand:+ start:180 stop:1118 length:939 start_codon:yes stop_codon:yes gene_type:complete